jgi:hypothetical protein
MNLTAVRNALRENDGSLPDINFGFGGVPVAADAYALIQSRASLGEAPLGHYWSKSRLVDCPIHFGENPAQEFLNGDAEPFHVLFGGIRSSSGAHIPPLGFFVFATDHVALDLRMGPEWDDGAIIGLFELVRDVSSLASPVTISHTCNIYDPDGRVFLAAYQRWLGASVVGLSRGS